MRLFGDGDAHLKPYIPQGALMRASSYKTIFDKGYMPNWTKEHFTVSQAVPPRKGTKRMYISWLTTTMKLWKAAGTQRRFRKFKTTRTASKKSYLGVLFLTAQTNDLSGGKVRLTSTLVDKGNRLVRCHRWAMSSRYCYQAMWTAIRETNPTYMRRNLQSRWFFLASGMWF